MTFRAQAIVVLGARVLEGGLPSGALRARTVRAVELFEDGAAPLLVFSGGLGLHGPTEAQVMLALARARGVPAAACLLEEESRSTFDNARHTARLLTPLGITQVLLVSDGFHLFRARQHFRLAGLEAQGVAAPLEGRGLTLASRCYWATREVVAVLRRPRLLFARGPPRPPSP